MIIMMQNKIIRLMRIAIVRNNNKNMIIDNDNCDIIVRSNRI